MGEETDHALAEQARSEDRVLETCDDDLCFPLDVSGF